LPDRPTPPQPSPDRRGSRNNGRPAITEGFDVGAATSARAVGGIAHETGELHRLLVESVQDYAIFALDPHGRVATWNEGAERINGYTAEEIVGQHFSIFYPRVDVEAGKPPRELEIASRTGKYEEEGWRVRKDGTQFWSSVLITAIRDDDGKLVGYSKVTRDLTERREAQARAIEDARRVASEEAARRAAESRERELRALAERLKAQAEELEKANLAKSEFLAAMSHELRTPLNAIAGYAELMELGVSGPVNAEQRQQLERIRRSQQHLLGIINDILNFSKIEAGHLTYDIAPVPIDEVMVGVEHMMELQARMKEVRLERRSCPEALRAMGDRAKLEQILINLAGNAVKFTDEGGLVVLRCERSGDRVVITVRDTGHGIPADQLDRIFEPFVQVGRSLTSMREGTGLGLAISRDLARAMGGDITVESVVGKVSTFTLTLPVAE
jgi:PAS domain S-box-containing protein